MPVRITRKEYDDLRRALFDAEAHVTHVARTHDVPSTAKSYMETADRYYRLRQKLRNSDGLVLTSKAEPMQELLGAIEASDGSAGAIKRTLAPTTNIGVGEAFWIGDGDDLLGALLDKDWKVHRYEAPYYWVVTRDGEFVSYTEGDIHYSDNPSCGG